MIQAPPGLKARFKRTVEGPHGTRTYYEYCRVCAFNNDGVPLIVSQTPERRLVPATWDSDYEGLVDTVTADDYIGLIPGGGWRYREEYTGENGQRRFYDQPLVAWALRRDGSIVPLQADGDGLVSVAEPFDGTYLVIYHPDRLEWGDTE